MMLDEHLKSPGEANANGLPSPTSPPTLNYHQPPRSGRVEAWLRRLPRPSWISFLWLLFTVVAAVWLNADREPWVVTHQFEGAFPRNSPEACISPDGKQLAAIYPDPQTLRIYHLATGRALRDLRRPSGDVTTAVFSPDGSCIWSVGTDQHAILWEVATGRALATLAVDDREPSDYGSASASPFSADGQWVAATDEHVMRICDGRTGTVLVELAPTTYSMRSPLFSPNGRYLAAVCGYPPWEVWIWETKTWQRIATLSWAGGQSRIGNRGLAFTPDSTKLIFAREPRVEVWDAETNLASIAFIVAGHLHGCRLLPDGRYLITYNENIPVELWDMTTHARIGVLTPFGYSSVISPDGTRIAGACGIGSFPSLQPLANVNLDAQLAWLPDSRSFLSQTWASAHIPYDDRIRLFQQRRPEAAYGILWLLPFWVLFFGALASAWFIRRDLRSWFRHPPSL